MAMHFFRFLCLGLFVLVIQSGCQKEPLTTCQTMDFSQCQLNEVTYDTSKAGRHVLIIGIDGFRADAMTAANSPLLHQLSEDPQVYFTDMNQIEDFTFSGPNWSSLVTGVHWCKHQVTDNDYSSNNLNQTPHFFKLVEQANSALNTISYVNWTPINEHSAAEHADLAPTESANDQEIFEMAIAAVEHGQPVVPHVLFLQFDELDGAGHSYCFSPSSAEYTSTLSIIDGYIAQLHSVITERRNDGEEWLVCVVTDHGGDGTGHSGGQGNEHIDKSIFYAECPQLNFSSRESEQVDLVPTVLEYLGVYSAKFECYKDGSSLIAN
jgi:predicted AlkP superfamily pyrophosphatase or phosphodiesterase